MAEVVGNDQRGGKAAKSVEFGDAARGAGGIEAPGGGREHERTRSDLGMGWNVWRGWGTGAVTGGGLYRGERMGTRGDRWLTPDRGCGPG